jgi:hypothetical protein
MGADQAETRILQTDFGHCPIKTHSVNTTFGFCLSQVEEGECFTPVTTLENTMYAIARLPSFHQQLSMPFLKSTFGPTRK